MPVPVLSLTAPHTACEFDRMPYPIIVGCVKIADDMRNWHSMEFTPQYSGLPAQNCVQMAQAAVAGAESVPAAPLGGVLVEVPLRSSKCTE